MSSATTTTTVKQRRTTAASRNTPAPVGAQNFPELLGSVREDNNGMMKYIRLTGKHASATWREIVFNFIMEMIGVFILSMAVPLVAFQAGPTTNVPAGAALAIVYALAYYVACSLPRDLKLKAHCNPAITLCYWGVADVGAFGALLYIVAGSAGAFAAGGALRQILSQQDGVITGPCPGAGCVMRAAVPLPVLSGVTSFGISKTTAVCLEIFIPAIIALVQVVSEYLNTNNKRLLGSYYRAVRHGALATGVLVAIGYTLQCWAFNPYIYLAGLTTGISESGMRDINTLARLSGTDMLPNSVFGVDGDNGAWALYYFGPWAGGLVAALICRILFGIGFLRSDNPIDTDGADYTYRNTGPTRPGFINADIQQPLLHQAARVDRPGTELRDLVNPFVAGPVAQ